MNLVWTDLDDTSCKDFAVHGPLTTSEKGQTPEAHELQSSLFAGLAHPFRQSPFLKSTNIAS